MIGTGEMLDAGVAIIFFGVLIALASAGYAIYGALTGPRRNMQRRADGIHRRFATKARAGAKTVASVKREEKSSIPVLDNLAKRFVPRQAVLRTRLVATGRNIAVGPYLLVNLIVMVVSVVIAAMIFGLPLLLALLVGVVCGMGLPHLVIGRLIAVRIKRFNQIFPDAIDLIVRGLKSGLPVTESMAEVGREMADPVGVEFRRVGDNVRLGQNLEESLWDTAKRLNTQEFDFFVISLSVQRETGGNLAETLANLSEILRQRRQLKLKVRAMSSEARASAYILGSLPFIMFTLIYFMNPDYMTTLFIDPRGHVMLGLGLTMMAIGVGVMAKMVRFEV